MTNRAISAKNYEHVLDVWKAFKINTMKDNHDCYLKVDVSLFACVLETFGKEYINSFKLVPVHYLSTAGCSWDAV